MIQRTYPLEPNSLIIQPPTPASVQVLPTGEVTLRWDGVSPVAIHACLTPTFTSNLIQLADSSPVTFADPFPQRRTYFHLHFSSGKRLVVAERDILLQGAVNMRDVGGYLTHDGLHVVRWGKLYRSGQLATLTYADHQTLKGLGIGLVCDLRTTGETAVNPNNLTIPHTYHHAHIRNDSQWRRIKSTLIGLFWRRALPQAFLDVYTQVTIENNADVLHDLFLWLVKEDSLPAVVHCAAGKDRTGIVVALLLEVLGVPRATILAEYSLSNRFYDAFADSIQQQIKPITRFGMTTDKLQPLLLADPMILEGMLRYIDHHYESVVHYLCNKVGLAPHLLEQLRQQFLVSVC